MTLRRLFLHGTLALVLLLVLATGYILFVRAETSAPDPSPHHTVRAESTPAHAWKFQWRADQDLYAVQAVTPDLIFIVGDGGSIYKSENGGRTWHYATLGSDVPLRGLAFVSPQVGWVVGKGGLIYKTENGGLTWHRQPSGQRRDLMDIWAFDAQHALVVGAGGLILRTDDGGATWTTVPSATGQTLLALWFQGDEGWAVGNGGTIVRTTDRGATWQPVRGGGGALRDVAFAPEGTRGIAVGDGGVILRSDDGGASWSPVAAGTSVVLQGVTFGSDGRAWIVGNLSTVLHETESGTFEDLSPPDTATANLHAVMIDPRGRIWAVGRQGQVIRSDDGGASWTQPTGGGIAEFWDVSFPDALHGWAIGQRFPGQQVVEANMCGDRPCEYRGVVLHTEDGGKTWAPQPLPTPPVGSVLEMMGISFPDTQHGVATGRLGRIFYTDDGGKHWHIAPPNPPSALWMQRVALQKDGRGWSGGQGGRVWKTEDFGHSWVYKCFNWYDPVCYKRPSFSLPIYGVATQGDRAWFTGRGSGGGYILLTQDNGDTWSKVLLNAGRGRSHLWNIFFLTEDEGWAVGVTGIVWHTENGGATADDWTLLPQDPDLQWTDIFDVAFLSSEDGFMAGADCDEQMHGGTCDVFLPVNPYDGAVVGRTEDGGKHWEVERFPSVQQLYGIAAAGEGEAWAVGSGGTILHYAGPPNELNALKLAEPLPIDGSIADWPVPAEITVTASTADLVIGDRVPSPQDISARVRALWGEEGLYLGIEVTDDVLFAPEGNPLAGDAVILGLDGEGDNTGGGPGDHVYTVTLDGHIWENDSRLSDIPVALHRFWNGYIVEILLPQDVLGARLAHGRNVGFSLALQDNDGTETPESVIVADSEDYTTPSSEFGRIHIIGDTLVIQAGVSTVGSIVDTYIDRYHPYDNYNEGDATAPPIGPLPWLHIYRARQWDVQSILFKFDVSFLPKTADIVDAALTLRSGTCRYNACSIPLTVGAYRLLRPWDPKVVNWYVARLDENGGEIRWERPGANGETDRLMEPDDTAVIPRSFVDVTWHISRSVKAWVADPAKNYGILLHPDEGIVEYKIPSSEFDDPQRRPKLTIQYALHPQVYTPTPTFTPTMSPTPGPSPTPTPTPTVTPTPTPTPTPVIVRSYELIEGVDGYEGVDDTYIAKWHQDSPQGKDSNLYVQTDNAYVLMRWDLSQIPEGARVQEATLRMWSGSGPAAMTLHGHLVKRAWSEEEATWINARDGDPWAVPGAFGGADIDATPVFTESIPAGTGYVEIDVKAAVQYWLDHPDENFGVLLAAVEPGARHSFTSSEWPGIAQRPRLNLTVILPAPTPTPSPTPTVTPTPSPTPTGTPTPTATPTPTQPAITSRAYLPAIWR